MIRGRHRRTNEYALLQKFPGGLCIAQFDRFDHPESHGWHLHLRREFDFANPVRRRQRRRRTLTPWQEVVRGLPLGQPTHRRPTQPEMQRLP